MIQLTKIPMGIEYECEEEYEEDIEFIYPEVKEKLPLYMGEGFGM